VSRLIEEFLRAKGAAATGRLVAGDEKKGAERFHPANCAGWGGGLSAQADAFIPQKARDGEECAGAKAEEKVGQLRSE
jgi:hypothetical protein